MDEKIKEQILAIRDTGLTNMFDVNMVQRLAYELVLYLEDHWKEYAHFILTGEAQTTQFTPQNFPQDCHIYFDK